MLSLTSSIVVFVMTIVVVCIVSTTIPVFVVVVNAQQLKQQSHNPRYNYNPTSDIGPYNWYKLKFPVDSSSSSSTNQCNGTLQSGIDIVTTSSSTTVCDEYYDYNTMFHIGTCTNDDIIYIVNDHVVQVQLKINTITNTSSNNDDSKKKKKDKKKRRRYGCIPPSIHIPISTNTSPNTKKAPNTNTTSSSSLITYNRYEFVQYHIHIGQSEHTWDQQYYNGELHIVHELSSSQNQQSPPQQQQPQPPQYAVIGIPIQIYNTDNSKSNTKTTKPNLETTNVNENNERYNNHDENHILTVLIDQWQQYVISNIDDTTKINTIYQKCIHQRTRNTTTTTTTNKIFNPYDMLQQQQQEEEEYYDLLLLYHYIGSLTTPPCTENVIWYMIQQPIIIISQQQYNTIEQFIYIMIMMQHQQDIEMKNKKKKKQNNDIDNYITIDPVTCHLQSKHSTTIINTARPIQSFNNRTITHYCLKRNNEKNDNTINNNNNTYTNIHNNHIHNSVETITNNHESYSSNITTTTIITLPRFIFINDIPYAVLLCRINFGLLLLILIYFCYSKYYYNCFRHHNYYYHSIRRNRSSSMS